MLDRLYLNEFLRAAVGKVRDESMLFCCLASELPRNILFPDACDTGEHCPHSFRSLNSTGLIPSAKLQDLTAEGSLSGSQVGLRLLGPNVDVGLARLKAYAIKAKIL